jgi:hypothetical protein
MLADMPSGFHIVRQPSGWAVRDSGAQRVTSVHRTQAEAVATARRRALKSGGAEVVVHRADGRIRHVDTVGAATLDELKRSGQVTPRPPVRAPRSQGPRTTLRLPPSLATITDHLARELDVSRNDALLRLATRGARLYEREQSIAARRQERWAAVVPGVVDIDRAELPSPDEARDAVLAASDEGPGAPAG